MTKFKISASALNKFFSCPAKYAYSRKFRSKELSPWLKWGLDAHALMEGEPAPFDTYKGREFHKELEGLRKEYGYEIIEHEIEQVVDVDEDVELVRRVDALALLKGRHVLIDWKTAGKPWLSFDLGGHRVAPKGAGFQAASYLLPPRDEDLEALGLETWPERIDFIVADGKGGDRFKYWRNQGDEDNLRDAIERLKISLKRDIIVKNKGFGCRYCDFNKMCYGVPGWEEDYELRGKE